MSNRIRRHSMERLKLYDFDQIKPIELLLPPPIPPPRKRRQRLPEEFAFERYQFLCDMQRHSTDPIYAATPMFTTITPANEIKYPRRILGLRIPNDIIKPRTPSISSSDSESTDSDKHSKENFSDEDDNQNSENNDDDDDAGGDSSSSSSSSSTDDDINNDDDNKGIVEQIFNRDKNE